MTTRPTRYVTPDDVALLQAVARTGSVQAGAAAALMDRDRAVYRLRRLAEVFHQPVVRTVRGGARHGGSGLTPLGWSLIRRGSEVVPSAPGTRPRVTATILDGVFRSHPVPHVETHGGLALAVAFHAEEGEPVRVAIDPELVLVARRRFPTSARNVLPGRVTGFEGDRTGDSLRISVSVEGGPVAVGITPQAVRELGLHRGVRVVLYVKATGIRRVATGRGGRPVSFPDVKRRPRVAGKTQSGS